MGRPPRTDDPQPLTILLPSALKRWLGAQAKREGRGMGMIVVAGLTLLDRRYGSLGVATRTFAGRIPRPRKLAARAEGPAPAHTEAPAPEDVGENLEEIRQ